MSLLKIIELSILNYQDFIIKFLDNNDFINVLTLSKIFRGLIKNTKNFKFNTDLIFGNVKNVFDSNNYNIDDLFLKEKKIDIEFLKKVKKVFPFLSLDLKLVLKNFNPTDFFELYRDALNLFDSLKLEISRQDYLITTEMPITLPFMEDCMFCHNIKNIDYISLIRFVGIDLTPIMNIKKISLYNSNNISDISALINVEELSLECCENICDISCLKKIKNLTIIDCVKIKIIPSIITLEKLTLENNNNQIILNYLPNIKKFKKRGIKSFELFDPNSFSEIFFEEILIECTTNENFELPIIKNVKKLFIDIKYCHINLTNSSYFQVLQELTIYSNNTISTISSIQSLKKLEIRECHNLKIIKDLVKLEELHIYNCETLEIVTNLPKVQKNLKVVFCPKLRIIENIENLEKLYMCMIRIEDFSFISKLKNIKKLDLIDCYNFTELDLSNKSLKYLNIKNCDMLQNVYVDNIQSILIQESNSLLNINFNNFKNTTNLTNIDKIIINKCRSLKVFDLENRYVKYLEIEKSYKLEKLIGCANVETISISNCDALNSFLSSNLSSFKNMNKFIINFNVIEHYPFVNNDNKIIGIRDFTGLLECPNLEEVEFHNSNELYDLSFLTRCPNLKKIKFYYCKNLGDVRCLKNIHTEFYFCDNVIMNDICLMKNENSYLDLFNHF